MKKQRIVVKVGTSTLTHDSGSLNLRSMEHLVRALADLHGCGNEIILVTSGAIAVGTARLGLSERPPGAADETGRRRGRSVPDDAYLRQALW